MTQDVPLDLLFQGWESKVHKLQKDIKKGKRGKEGKKEIVYLELTMFKYSVLSIRLSTTV